MFLRLLPAAADLAPLWKLEQEIAAIESAAAVAASAEKKTLAQDASEETVDVEKAEKQ